MNIKKELNEAVNNILYSAVVLNIDASKRLLYTFKSEIESIELKSNTEWKLFGHHMTIVFGKPLSALNLGEWVGKEVDLRVTHIGSLDNVIAVKVMGFKSTNDNPHITLAVDTKNGGKPFMSNKITNWTPIEGEVIVKGIVSEILK